MNENLLIHEVSPLQEEGACLVELLLANGRAIEVWVRNLEHLVADMGNTHQNLVFGGNGHPRKVVRADQVVGFWPYDEAAKRAFDRIFPHPDAPKENA